MDKFTNFTWLFHVIELVAFTFKSLSFKQPIPLHIRIGKIHTTLKISSQKKLGLKLDPKQRI